MTVLNSLIRFAQARKIEKKNCESLADDIVAKALESIENQTDIVTHHVGQHSLVIITPSESGFPNELEDEFGRKARIQSAINLRVCTQLRSQGVNAISSMLSWLWWNPLNEEDVFVTAKIWYKD